MIDNIKKVFDEVQKLSFEEKCKIGERFGDTLLRFQGGVNYRCGFNYESNYCINVY